MLHGPYLGFYVFVGIEAQDPGETWIIEPVRFVSSYDSDMGSPCAAYAGGCTHTYIHICTHVYTYTVVSQENEICLLMYACIHFPRRLYKPPRKYLFVFPIQPRWEQQMEQEKMEEWQCCHHRSQEQAQQREAVKQPLEMAKMEMSLRTRSLGKEA